VGVRTADTPEIGHAAGVEGAVQPETVDDLALLQIVRRHDGPAWMLRLSPPKPSRARLQGRAIALALAQLHPLPACHQGVYARLRRAMERAGVRGPLRASELVERAPHPDLLPASGEKEKRPRPALAGEGTTLDAIIRH